MLLQKKWTEFMKVVCGIDILLKKEELNCGALSKSYQFV